MEYYQLNNGKICWERIGKACCTAIIYNLGITEEWEFENVLKEVFKNSPKGYTQKSLNSTKKRGVLIQVLVNQDQKSIWDPILTKHGFKITVAFANINSDRDVFRYELLTGGLIEELSFTKLVTKKLVTKKKVAKKKITKKKVAKKKKVSKKKKATWL